MESTQLTLTGEIVQEKQYTDECRLRDLYETQGKSVAEIAQILECSETTIRDYMRWFGIELENNVDRDPSPAGYVTRPDGYRRWQDGHQTLYVHRLLAVAEWGFDAVAGSHVHHKNRHRWDNRIENLRLFDSASAHARHHARPEVTEDQQEMSSYPTRDGDSHERPAPRQMKITAFQNAAVSD